MPTEAMALCTAKMNALFSQQQKFGQTCEQINKTKKNSSLCFTGNILREQHVSQSMFIL